MRTIKVFQFLLGIKLFGNAYKQNVLVLPFLLPFGATRNNNGYVTRFLFFYLFF